MDELRATRGGGWVSCFSRMLATLRFSCISNSAPSVGIAGIQCGERGPTLAFQTPILAALRSEGGLRNAKYVQAS